MGNRLFVSAFCLINIFLVSCAAKALTGDAYRTRYVFKDANQKLVDNQGDGFAPLYGTRNFRSVLNGVYYRGGANNFYHQPDKRNNQNPLPDDGLENLCKEGFTTAVYLYSTNYNTAPHSVRCTMNDGSVNQLTYMQLSILLASSAEIKNMLQLILAHVRDPKAGPLYAHCWNGWHASGLMATYTLRQFCDFSAEEGVAYWNSNTDGNDGSAYESIRTKIRGFVRFPDLELSAAEKRVLCPQVSSLKF